MKRILSLMIVFLAIFLIACAAPMTGRTPDTAPPRTATPMANATLDIEADYQVASAFDESGIIAECAKQESVKVTVNYVSSTTLRVHQQDKNRATHAYWATSTNFLPGSATLTVYTAKSYIVIGAQRTLAQKLGWSGNFLTVQTVLNEIPKGQVKLGMTNPSQSDPSASFLVATAAVFSKENMLTGAGIDRLPEGLFKSYFGNLGNITDSADTLKSEILADLKNKTGKYNTYVLYEAQLIQINQELVRLGLEPLKAFYLSDATTGAKFPLAYMKGEETRDAFVRFANCVSKDAKSVSKLEARGYRTSESGFSMDKSDTKVFDPDWGVNATMADLPLKDYPRPEDAKKLFDLYQTSFRRPRIAISCNDYSGSMYEKGQSGKTGAEQLSDGMKLIFDQPTATAQSLQIGPKDSYSVFQFASGVQFIGTVYGSNPESVTAMYRTAITAKVSGSTAMFDCVREAINLALSDKIQKYDPVNYSYAIYVMTDGQTNAGWNWDTFRAFYQKLPQDQKIKIHGVGFGRDLDMSDNSQFGQMVKLGGGVLKNGTSNLADALKSLFNNY